ncbi:hypothetical protein J6590_048827 [Homalodisca vitripennis]|nr:hypothetical protein J6590_048827 [Homalodisca vitripennis]
MLTKITHRLTTRGARHLSTNVPLPTDWLDCESHLLGGIVVEVNLELKLFVNSKYFYTICTSDILNEEIQLKSYSSIGVAYIRCLIKGL